MVPALCVRRTQQAATVRARGVRSQRLRCDVRTDIDTGEIVDFVGRPGAGNRALYPYNLRFNENPTRPGRADHAASRATRLAFYVPQRAGYHYSFLSVREALEYYATMHDSPGESGIA